MIFGIAIIIIAFYWLMYETKWLTVRLPYGRLLINITQLVAIAVGIMVMVTVWKYIAEDIKRARLEKHNAVNTN